MNTLNPSLPQKEGAVCLTRKKDITFSQQLAAIKASTRLSREALAEKAIELWSTSTCNSKALSGHERVSSILKEITETFSLSPPCRNICIAKNNALVITLSLFYDPLWRLHFVPFLKKFFEDKISPCFSIKLMAVLVEDLKCGIETLKCKHLILEILKVSENANKHCKCAFRFWFLTAVFLPLYQMDHKDLYESAYSFFRKTFQNEETFHDFIVDNCNYFVPTIFQMNAERIDDMLNFICHESVVPSHLKDLIIEHPEFHHQILHNLIYQDYEKVDKILDCILSQDETNIATFKRDLFSDVYNCPYPNCKPLNIDKLLINIIIQDEDCKCMERLFVWIFGSSKKECYKSLLFRKSRVVNIVARVKLLLRSDDFKRVVGDFLNWLYSQRDIA